MPESVAHSPIKMAGRPADRPRCLDGMRCRHSQTDPMKGLGGVFGVHLLNTISVLFALDKISSPPHPWGGDVRIGREDSRALLRKPVTAQSSRSYSPLKALSMKPSRVAGEEKLPEISDRAVHVPAILSVAVPDWSRRGWGPRIWTGHWNRSCREPANHCLLDSMAGHRHTRQP